ncbi:hypothetical protein [Actinomadura sp. WAC 06369]|uniref:hypothetical protein n=1 Tax=Actinomadura sp. WAC 06369 TaxID=2203193 RepID=UPI001F3033BC|nr:hypothetical protein [Actinomadura sp. WAC 06369]
MNRFGNVRVLFGGLLVAAAAYGLFLPLGIDWAYLLMFPLLFLIGVDEREHGVAAGLLYTAIQFGMALGLSAVTAVHVAALGDGGPAGARLDALRTALLVPFGAVLLAAFVTAFGLRERRRAPGPAEPVPSAVEASA